MIISATERFFRKVQRNGPLWNGTSCWVWLAHKDKDDYGIFWAEAILEAYGNITLRWEWVANKNDSRCILETGELFEP